MTDDNLNPDRVRAVIGDAWARLSPQDRAERIAYDKAHNVLGVTMHTHGDSIEFVRGGRTLAAVHRDVLTGDAPLPSGEFVPEPEDMDAEINKLMDDEQ
jgi:hypothetical protein